MTKELQFNWVQTCGACPEQYDVFDTDGNYIAYVRLRWGFLSATSSANFDTVPSISFYDHTFKDGWLGSFPSDKSRAKHMRRIEKAIRKKSGNGSVTLLDTDTVSE